MTSRTRERFTETDVASLRVTMRIVSVKTTLIWNLNKLSHLQLLHLTAHQVDPALVRASLESQELAERS